MKINEESCLSRKLKEPIAIRSLKRFVADRDTGKWKRFSKKLPPTGKKVAIVGSGPAGLTAGYYLAKRGHSVTVFEALSRAGGMMRFGIPDYRLPKDVLDAEIERFGCRGRTSALIPGFSPWIASFSRDTMPSSSHWARSAA